MASLRSAESVSEVRGKKLTTPGSKPAVIAWLRSTKGIQMIKIKLIRSRIGSKPKQRAVLDGLGLRKINAVREFQDGPALRGAIEKASIWWRWYNNVTS